MHIRGLRAFSVLTCSLAVAFVACAPSRGRSVDDGSDSVSPSGGTTGSDDFSGDDISGDDGSIGAGPGLPSSASCGDGVLDSDEACDDGNEADKDGCGANCRFVEPGFVCPDAGKPCRSYAKCGDGKIIFPEQCDDGGVAAGDGCSSTCKFEIGSTCDGEPSTCRPTVCGDGAQEGSETCEAADGVPFDGCSLTCQAEPQCTDAGCTSKCGDGLVIGAEQCDDGNATPGDGCSDTCQSEPGYECTKAPPCEGADCTLTLPIIYRDFNADHSDFEPGECKTGVTGIVQDMLSAEGKPQLVGASNAKACVASTASFTEWYTKSANNAQIVSSITLYNNGDGGYVNRLGPDGEPYTVMMDTGNENAGYGTNATTCAATCTTRTHDGYQCENICQPEHQAVTQRQQTLAQEEAKTDPDPDVIAALEEEIATLTAASDACDEQCQTEFDRRVAACTASCGPCSFDADQWCTGGEEVAFDGNPLFFPIDDPTPGILTDTRGSAKIPSQVYNAVGWPWENPACGTEGTCNLPPLHNFHFTSEIAYWFKYEEGMVAKFQFIGDDDVWVFINRRLALDLGGIHVPWAGEMSITAQGALNLRTWEPGDGPNAADKPLSTNNGTMADFGMQPGGVYEIRVFHAERKMEGSSFQLTLSGFDAARSECSAICGDGIIAAGEQCDNGKDENTGGHNRCSADCTLGTYCGDGVVQEADGEQCDDGDPAKPPGCAGCRIIVVK